MKAVINYIISGRDCGQLTITDTNETFYFNFDSCDEFTVLNPGAEVVVTTRKGKYCDHIVTVKNK